MITTERYTGKAIPFAGNSMAATFSTTAIETYGYSKGLFALDWSGADATDGLAYVQGSIDGTNWHNLGGADGRLTINAASGVQAWQLTSIEFPYLRFRMEAGSNTAGTANIEVWLA
jgi:hypothetical protein